MIFIYLFNVGFKNNQRFLYGYWLRTLGGHSASSFFDSIKIRWWWFTSIGACASAAVRVVATGQQIQDKNRSQFHLYVFELRLVAFRVLQIEIIVRIKWWAVRVSRTVCICTGATRPANRSHKLYYYCYLFIIEIYSLINGERLLRYTLR